jgi:lysozyme family protein
VATGNFDACQAITLKWEGGLSNHKDDPGGLTWKGVSTPAGAAYRRKKGLSAKPVNRWSDAEVRAFYVSEYWVAVRCDSLIPGVDLATYDAAVNSGPARAKTWLGVSLGGDGMDTIKRICAARLSFLHVLSTWKVFGRGWANRVADIEAKGVVMWLKWKNAPNATDVLQGEADASGKQAKTQGGGAVTTAGVGAASGGYELWAGNANWIIVGSLLVLLAIAAGALAIRAQQNRAREAAYRAEALALS